MVYPEDQGFESMSYSELWDRVRSYAAALESLGLQRGDRLAVQSENCVEWAWLDWACQALGVVLVPIYPTLPADQAKFIVKDCGTKLVVAGGEDQAEKSKGLEGVSVVQLKEGAGSVAGIAATLSNGMSEAELLSRIDAVSPSDLATIIYTSGTTGRPKGVMLPHSAPTWLLKRVVHSLPVDERDVFLTFLPMSHVFERVAGQWLPIHCGATAAFAKSLMSLASDIRETRPTILLGVPRFLEATRERILDSMKKAPFLRRKLFELALVQGTKRARGGFAPLAGAMDAIVGKKVRERLGGRLRFFVSGGAALPPHVAEFYLAFRILVLQGYGLTETTAASSVNHPERSKYWTVGEPIEGVEVRIAEDGEVLIRGKSVMSGYYNLPEETAAAIDAEGWFHTGDIGEWEGKHLKITDRKKDLLVLANGKNVAPQPIENKLKESPYIQEAVLFGDGSEYVYGLVVPNFELIRKELKGRGLDVTADDAQVLELPQVAEIIRSAVAESNRTLADFEKVKKYALVSAAFSVDSGELTPTLKVKRKVVKERFASVLAGLER